MLETRKDFSPQTFHLCIAQTQVLLFIPQHPYLQVFMYMCTPTHWLILYICHFPFTSLHSDGEWQTFKGFTCRKFFPANWETATLLPLCPLRISSRRWCYSILRGRRECGACFGTHFLKRKASAVPKLIRSVTSPVSCCLVDKASWPISLSKDALAQRHVVLP